MQYDFSNLERKWKENWEETQLYKVSNDSDKPKYYVLDMFPYPSGAGLHVGHPLGYVASDIYARYKRLNGFNVLHPMGYDAFGLPAEQYAIDTGNHPAGFTDANIEIFKKQLDNLGFSYDWSRAFKTSDSAYYKWTQWIFIQLFDHYFDNVADKAMPIADLVSVFEQLGNKSVDAATSQEEIFSAADWQAMSPKEKDVVLMNYRLVFRKVGYVNWCEKLGTVLANDEVKDGFSERGGYPVTQKSLVQWGLRTTAYADRLLRGLDTIDWSESLKAMQTNWIGKSKGAQVFFDLVDHDEKIEVFTTRPDTIFGATFMVIAPEHDLVKRITTPQQIREINSYLAYMQTRTERDRMEEVKKVTGAFTGAYAINPLTKTKVPVWISEYVLKDYGTGAIMAVPSDDDRDKRFAEKFGIDIIDVVDKSDYPGATLSDKVGKMINSGFLNGMEVKEAIEATIDKLEAEGIGKGKVNFKLRDANYSRQRYWGEPIPIKYDADGVAHALDISELPLELPDLDDFKPSADGKSPLEKADFWNTTADGMKLETDTMPGFAGSSWYFLRYMDPNNEDAFASDGAIKYWQQVDLYIGGTEHAVGHLLYSRMWNHFLYDIGKVPTKEPFKKLINQGMIGGIIEFVYLKKEKTDGNHHFVCADLVAAREMDEEDLIKYPIHIDFVQNYGASDSYLSKESIQQFIEWRPEFEFAIFECGMGKYQAGKGNDGPHLVTKSEPGKMSKRYFNTVNPDHVVEKYGTDCFRLYEMFLGPLTDAKPWNTQGIDGCSKFLRKFWALFYNENGDYIVSDEAPSKEALKVVHATIKKVSSDMERFSFNTCVSAFMVATNELRKLKGHNAVLLKDLVVLMAPFAPFISEELWKVLGNEGSVHQATFPSFDESYLKEDSITYPISINGKKRDTMDFPANATKEEIEAIARDLEVVQKWAEGKTIRKIIVVPGRMVNVVVG